MATGSLVHIIEELPAQSTNEAPSYLRECPNASCTLFLGCKAYGVGLNRERKEKSERLYQGSLHLSRPIDIEMATPTQTQPYGGAAANTYPTPASESRPTPSQGQFDKYCVIHIATTCDEHGVYVTKDSAEVIEIGWVVVDARDPSLPEVGLRY